MRWRGANIGARVKLLSGIWIDRFSSLQIGDDVSLAKGIIMVAAGGVNIGARSMIGYGTTILTVNHCVPKNRGSMRFSGAELKEVIIENDVWVGAKVVLLPGVTVGEGSIVGAGAVVTKDVPPFSMVGGVPAKVIGIRD
ncbi:MAG: acyltransferase [Gammaproteobacteria bacterium]|nr:acyltransferase [Gammaproteobacteria bacterium]